MGFPSWCTLCVTSHLFSTLTHGVGTLQISITIRLNTVTTPKEQKKGPEDKRDLVFLVDSQWRQTWRRCRRRARRHPGQAGRRRGAARTGWGPRSAACAWTPAAHATLISTQHAGKDTSSHRAVGWSPNTKGNILPVPTATAVQTGPTLTGHYWDGAWTPRRGGGGGQGERGGG